MLTQVDHINTIRTAKESARAIVTAEATLRDDYAKIEKELGATKSAAASLDEVLANMERLVDQRAAQWAENNARTFVRLLSDRLDVSDHFGNLKERWHKAELPSIPGEGQANSNWIFGVAPDLMKARLTEVIRNSGARFGLPKAERVKRVSELEALLAAAEAHHTELVDTAAEVGIVLQLLDVVRERREKEAREAERARELAVQREHQERRNAELV